MRCALVRQPGPATTLQLCRRERSSACIRCTRLASSTFAVPILFLAYSRQGLMLRDQQQRVQQCWAAGFLEGTKALMSAVKQSPHLPLSALKQPAGLPSAWQVQSWMPAARFHLL